MDIQGKIEKNYIFSEYAENTINTFKKSGGKWNSDIGAWKFQESRAKNLFKEMFGESPDIVTVKVTLSQTTGYAQYTIGGYLIVGRRGRDNAVRFGTGAFLLEGEIPMAGGSAKNPAVMASKDAVFTLNVRKDFATENYLEIIKEFKTELPVSALAKFTDDELVNEIISRKLGYKFACPARA